MPGPGLADLVEEGLVKWDRQLRGDVHDPLGDNQSHRLGRVVAQQGAQLGEVALVLRGNLWNCAKSSIPHVYSFCWLGTLLTGAA